MTPDEIKVRDTKAAEGIVKKALSELRKKTPYIGHVDQGFDRNEYVVTIETNLPEYAVDTLEWLVGKSARATMVESRVYPGSFDWAADTYVKDGAYVAFKF